ncbi:MAG: glycosyltransferase [Candidatus Hydrogenedentes bacterium]|nr:glycosyltransferase [Candidatus Hydrogenedentota bacterium]
MSSLRKNLDFNGQMRVSVIIPTCNRCDGITELLHALNTAMADHDACELIVVDDASTDGTNEALATTFPEVRLVRCPVPSQPSRARNLGAAEARGSLLLFLDDDGVVDEGWLTAMLVAEREATVLLGNVVDFHGGRVQSVPRRTTFIGKSLRCRPERANTGPSCNLGIPRACFEALGGFDEELPYYFEDSDLCIRAARAGFDFRFVADAVFRHRGSEQKTGDAIRMQEHNSTYAMLKYYEDDVLRSLTFSVLNGVWMGARFAAWALRGRFGEAGLLLCGWAGAYLRYVRTRL